MNKSRRIVTICCLCVLNFFTLSIFVRFITQNVLFERMHLDNTFTRTVLSQTTTPSLPINWATLYPFQSGDRAIDPQGIVAKLKAKLAGLEKAYTIDGLPGYIYMVENAARYEKLLGWNLHEKVIELGDGHLTGTVQRVDVTPCADSLAEFNAYLKTRGIGLLYAQSPHKICRYDEISGRDEKSPGDFSNQNADSLLALLDARGIPYIDFREALHTTPVVLGISESAPPAQYHHSLFYRTDHHWKAESGLWASGVLAGFLNAHNGFTIDTALFAPERYRREVYPNANLGSLGRIITLALRLERQGDFGVIYKEKPTKSDYRTSFYDHAYSIINETIRNTQIPSGARVLFIGDSFVKALVPFLALGVESVSCIDVRGFTGSVRTYIAQHIPDMVIVMYNPSCISMDSSEHRAMFDFR